MRPTLFLIAFWVTVPLSGEPITFNKHIAPIIFQSCSPCHHPGESAPFSLLNYQDVRQHAAQIVAVTERGYMPPWPPQPGYGEFVGSRRLSAKQLQLILAWVHNSTPEGDPGTLPPPPRYTEEWQLGPPDLIVEMPQSYRLAADGADVFRNFVLPISLQDTKYVRAVEMHPGNKKIVHHANIVVDRTQSLRSRDAQDGQPGFPGMDVATESGPEFDPDSHFLFWKPGSVPHFEPEDMAWKIDPGTDLILNMHLQPSGKVETLKPKIGIYFATHPPTRLPMLVQLENDGVIDIPAGTRTFAVTDHLTLPVDVDVLAIYPHAHYLGKEIEAWAVLPDGTRRWLIRIADWDINWQAVYDYREPVSLPRGTQISMRILYDNTDLNPRNPNHPPQPVRAGDRSVDEMGHVWLQVLPKGKVGEDGRQDLQQAVMKRRLEKYPNDFVAHYSLAALLSLRGMDREALPHFEEAVRAQPSNVTARNGLSAALLANDRPEDAIRELRQTLEGDPEYVNAHYNLARAFTAVGQLESAIPEFEAYLQKRPEDVSAHRYVGDLYIGQNRLEEALPHLREVVRLDPNSADALTNLGALLARRGDLQGAILSFERALAIDPTHKVARSDLKHARAQ